MSLSDGSNRSQESVSVPEEGSGRQSGAVLAERVWFAALATVALVVLVASSILLASAHPDSCGLCHSSEIASLESNAHASLRCETCHAGTTPVGVLESRLAVIDMTLSTVIPFRETRAAEAPSRLCLECHDQGMSATIVVDGLRMNHRAPIEAGWECRTCHPGTGHEVRMALGGYTMDMCLGCHSTNPGNLATCEVCHVEGGGSRRATREVRSPWRITHGQNWESTHGMGDLSTCAGCHPSGYCVRCHGENVPHPANYLAQHGADVLRRTEGREQCLSCHRSDACDDCHGLEMPHPEEFVQLHADSIREEGAEYEEVCTRCHKRESCDDCHVKHTHPGLAPERIDELRRRPVSAR